MIHNLSNYSIIPLFFQLVQWWSKFEEEFGWLVAAWIHKHTSFSQSILSVSMVLFYIKQVLHEVFNSLYYTYSMQVPHWCQKWERRYFYPLKRHTKICRRKNVCQITTIRFEFMHQRSHVWLYSWNNIFKSNQYE